jgi:hypothetical protein
VLGVTRQALLKQAKNGKLYYFVAKPSWWVRSDRGFAIIPAETIEGFEEKRNRFRPEGGSAELAV